MSVSSSQVQDLEGSVSVSRYCLFLDFFGDKLHHSVFGTGVIEPAFSRIVVVSKVLVFSFVEFVPAVLE